MSDLSSVIHLLAYLCNQKRTTECPAVEAGLLGARTAEHHPHLVRSGRDRIRRSGEVAEKQCLLREVDEGLNGGSDERACRTSQHFDAGNDADTRARGSYIGPVQLQKLDMTGINGHHLSSFTTSAIYEEIAAGIVKLDLYRNGFGRTLAR